MRRLIPLALLLASSAYAAEPSVYLDSREYRKVEKILSENMARYASRLDQNQRYLFKKSHDTWTAYVKAYCDFESSGVDGGTAKQGVMFQCMTARANERLRYVEKLSNCQEGDLSCPAW